MRKFYEHFNPTSFKIFTAVALFLLDLFNNIFLYMRVNNYDAFLAAFDTVMQLTQGVTIDNFFTAEYLKEIFGMTLQVILFLMTAFILIHALIYFYYYKNIVFCYYYIKIMTWVAAISTFFMGFGFNDNLGLAVYFLISPFYLYMAIGLGYFPIVKKVN